MPSAACVCMCAYMLAYAQADRCGLEIMSDMTV
jgi:hypothetical protein